MHLNKLEILKNFLDTAKANQRRRYQIIDQLNINPESILLDDSVIDQYQRLIELLLGDTSGWISWYIYDNDFGIKGMEAGLHNRLESITTPEQLLELIA